MSPQDAGEESPACLDGSPYGVYFRKSPTNSTKWTIYILGGGWCYNEALCSWRASLFLGSSKTWSSWKTHRCMNANEDGSMDDDCNSVVLPYCDGASFSGFRPKPWPAPGGVPELFFRGIRNLDAAVQFAFSAGMASATEFVLSGDSAGGLSTFLHADRVADQLALRAPGCKRVVAAPVVGFFLDHDNHQRDAANFTAFMKHIYGMQNLTFGQDGGLKAECLAAFPDSPHYCFMSPHMHRFVRTPLFVLSSKHDIWQVDNVLVSREPAAVADYGRDFVEDLRPMLEDPRENGAAITSCVCHDCDFHRLEVDGRTAMQWYADWYHGKLRGAAAFRIDTHGPNGDGELRPPMCWTLLGSPPFRV